MILCLLFHRINSTAYSNSLKLFRDNLEYILKNYNIVLPGEKLSKGKLNVCITFDDAYFDFYYYVFPLLREFNVKVLLSVPVKYILEENKTQNKIRLNIQHSEAMNDEIYKGIAPFCTWSEIREMVSSGLVEVASHSYSHRTISKGDSVNLNLEIVKSKEIIEQKIDKEIKSFVYPFGTFDKDLHQFIKKHYAYTMRIGNALNLNWENYTGVLYRVNADNLTNPYEPFKKRKLILYFLKLLINMIRNK